MAKVGAAYPAVELDDGFLGKDGKKVNMAEYLKGKKAIVVGLPGGACCVCGTPVLGLCGPGTRRELTPPPLPPRRRARRARAPSVHVRAFGPGGWMRAHEAEAGVLTDTARTTHPPGPPDRACWPPRPSAQSALPLLTCARAGLFM